MKWVNHKAVTFSVVYLLSSNLFASLISAVGSTFPDAIEGTDFKSASWKKNHRKFSHWGIMYLFLIFVCFIIGGGLKVLKFNPNEFVPFFTSVLKGQANYIEGIKVLSKFLFWFFVGGFFHILEDAITGKVPLINPTKKTFGVRLFPVGSMQEYLLTLAIIAVAAMKLLAK
ncbi:MAG: metal-dependent hydrolase [Brevinematia bacterium]